MGAVTCQLLRVVTYEKHSHVDGCTLPGVLGLVGWGCWVIDSRPKMAHVGAVRNLDRCRTTRLAAHDGLHIM
jgi:hypothetical protein